MAQRRHFVLVRMVRKCFSQTVSSVVLLMDRISIFIWVMHLLAVGFSQTECLSFTDNKSSLFYKKKGDGQTDSNFINIDIRWDNNNKIQYRKSKLAAQL